MAITSIDMSEAKKIISGLEHHPNDPDIVYATEDMTQIVPLVWQRFIKAAIFRVANPDIFNKAASQITTEQMNNFQHSPAFCYENGVLKLDTEFRDYKTENGKKPPNKIPTQEDLKIYPDTLLHEMNRVWDIFKPHMPEEQITTSFYAAAPKSVKYGYAPLFHAGDPISVHSTVGGGRLEFIAGSLSNKQKKVLDDCIQNLHLGEEPSQREIISLIKSFNNLPELKDKVFKTNYGDMVVFAEDFYHRSPSGIYEQGQLAVGGETQLDFPEAA